MEIQKAQPNFFLGNLILLQDVHESHVKMIKNTIHMLQICIITQLVFQDVHESHVKMIKKTIHRL